MINVKVGMIGIFPNLNIISVGNQMKRISKHFKGDLK